MRAYTFQALRHHWPMKAKSYERMRRDHNGGEREETMKKSMFEYVWEVEKEGRSRGVLP